jgi:hypothetical protein
VLAQQDDLVAGQRPVRVEVVDRDVALAPSNAPVPPVIAGVGALVFAVSPKAYSSVPPSNRAVPTQCSTVVFWKTQ